jgi:hypothetical protein
MYGPTPSTLDLEKLSWEQTGGVVLPFDDGHIPETFSGDEGTPTRIVNYPDWFENRNYSVYVYNDAIPVDLVDALYLKTCQESKHNAWGDYVTVSEVESYWRSRDKKNENERKNRNNDDKETDKNILVEVVARYLQLATKKGAPYACKLTLHGESADDALTEENELLKRSHGVAVWGLISEVGTKVDYHLDYAEQIRYQYNVINPPLLAGTLQCTRDKVDGGSYLVALDGIDHYKRHGYKGKKKCVDQKDLIEIPYRFNQMILHRGNLPHCSTKIENIHGDQRRVIIGFNVFCKIIGPHVVRFLIMTFEFMTDS